MMTALHILSSIILLTIMYLTSNNHFSTELGYTLIELIIVVAVIGILVAIIIPSYSKYIVDAQQSACMLEVKGYSNQVFYMLNDQGNNTILLAPTINACHSITDSTGWTINTQQKIIAIVKSPSNARIECDVPNETPCRVLP